MLRDYEILFIVRPDLDEDQLGEAVKTVDTLIANLGGKSKKSDVWGRRKLAFEVKHLREGQYVLTDFEIDPERVPELESTLAISENVFRHLVVRKPERTATPKRNRRGKQAEEQSAAAGQQPAPAQQPAAAQPAAAPAAAQAVAEAPAATEPAAEASAAEAAEPVAEAPADEAAEDEADGDASAD